MFSSYQIEFLTATILNWQKLLENDNHKQVIIDSMKWLVKQKRCRIFSFVIMPNHIHMIWQIADVYEREEVQGALFSFTSHLFKKLMKSADINNLSNYYVGDADREYQFWERDPMVKECWSHDFFLQKLEYIHYNPCQPYWNLVSVPEDYYWSSAAFYEKADYSFEWLTHYAE